MEHAIYRVTAFEILEAYTLQIYFDDGTEQVIDFEPVLYGPVFEPLRDLEQFNRVELVEEVGCLDGGLASLTDPGRHESYATILGRSQRDSISATKAGSAPLELMHWSMHSHSALFCEVRVNAGDQTRDAASLERKQSQ